MLSTIIAYGLATFAVAFAIHYTDLFTPLRNLGRWAEGSWWAYWPLMPLRAAAHCFYCFSFWPALVLSIVYWTTHSAVVDAIVIWFGAAGVAIAIHFVAKKEASDQVDDLIARFSTHETPPDDDGPPKPFKIGSE